MVSLTLGPKSYGTKISNNVNIVAPTLITPAGKGRVCAKYCNLARDPISDIPNLDSNTPQSTA